MKKISLVDYKIFLSEAGVHPPKNEMVIVWHEGNVS